jgi:MFS family permease
MYTSSFSLGTALSFLVAGQIAAASGWRWAFGAAAAAAAVSLVIALSLRRVPARPELPLGHLLDFRAVLKNRNAMGYVLGYGVHCWELFTLRSWLVALLAFSLALQQSAAGGWPSPTSVAMLSGLVAMAASIAGNELCVRFGRRRVVQIIMATSAMTACAIGFTTAFNYGIVVALALVYSACVQFDSAALTAGAVAAADPLRQGSTMAVHSLVGFGCGWIGPLVVGIVLDLTGNASTPLSWGLAFVSVGLIGVLGPLALRLAAPDSNEGR